MKAKICLGLFGVHIVNGSLHCGDFFRFFIGNFATECFFQRHYQFYGVQRIRAQIVLERRFVFHFFNGNTQLFCHNVFNFLFNLHDKSLKMNAVAGEKYDR